MGTYIVGGILLVIVALIIRKLVKEKKEGKSLQCGDCKSCGGCCGHERNDH